MRKASLVFIGILAAVPLAFGGASEEYYGNSYARMNYVQGDVYVQRTSDLGYENGEVNLPVVEGDKIGTRDGRVEIHLGRNNYLRLGPNTVVDVVRLPRRGDDRINIHVIEGGVFLRVSELPVEKGIEAHTLDASVYVIEEGLYRIEAGVSGGSEFYAYEGSLEIAGEEGSVILNAYERLHASNGRFMSNPEFFRAGSGDFERWNVSRDDLLSARSGSRYLPSEIYEYEDELNRSGRWVYERPYGYVWIPLHVQVDWRPYHYGRWVWYPVIGWTWVSSEPWGWSVYRYGRWHWRLGLGWYWIPTRHWGPAWVHWHWDAHYVAWSPLSYYNYPVVIINNRFYDRYSDRHYPVHSRALTVVHRAQLQSRAVHRNALRADRVSSLSAVNLRARQPDIRPSIDRSSAVSGVARNVLSKSSVRPVERPSSVFSRSSPMPVRRLSSSGEAPRSIRERAPAASPQGLSRAGDPVRREGSGSAPGRIGSSESPKPESLRRLPEPGETIKSYPPRSKLPSFGQPARPVSGEEKKGSVPERKGEPPAQVKKDPDKTVMSTRNSAPSSRSESASRLRIPERPSSSRVAAPSSTRSAASPRNSGSTSRLRIPERTSSSRVAAPASSTRRPATSPSSGSVSRLRIPERATSSRVAAPSSAGRSYSPPASVTRSGSAGRSSSPPRSSSVRSGSTSRSYSPPASSVRSGSSARSSSPPASSIRSGSASRSSSSGSSRSSGGPKKK
ncbi:MAG: DUF6600 domain-containing protein [Acidobacteriota bacterium]|nr:DUF6600 domain-containing protein [Acidobacteriota bacterium]